MSKKGKKIATRSRRKSKWKKKIGIGAPKAHLCGYMFDLVQQGANPKDSCGKAKPSETSSPLAWKNYLQMVNSIQGSGSLWSWKANKKLEL